MEASTLVSALVYLVSTDLSGFTLRTRNNAPVRPGCTQKHFKKWILLPHTHGVRSGNSADENTGHKATNHEEKYVRQADIPHPDPSVPIGKFLSVLERFIHVYLVQPLSKVHAHLASVAFSEDIKRHSLKTRKKTESITKLSGPRMGNVSPCYKGESSLCAHPSAKRGGPPVLSGCFGNTSAFVDFEGNSNLFLRKTYRNEANLQER